MAAVTSHGCTFSWNSSAVTEVTSISMSASKDTYEVTDLDDTSYKQFIAGLSEAECTIDVNYDPSAHDIFLTGLASGAAAATITFEDGSADTAFTFQAFLTGFDPSASTGSQLTASVSFKATGSVAEG